MNLRHRGRASRSLGGNREQRTGEPRGTRGNPRILEPNPRTGNGEPGTREPQKYYLSTNSTTRRPRFRLILPKFSFVCGVKSNPPLGSQTLVAVPPAPFDRLGTRTLQTVSSVRLMSLISVVVANDWLNRLKNPIRN